PLAPTYRSLGGRFGKVPAARAATMFAPGATRSGLTARLPTRGPRLEKEARRAVLGGGAPGRSQRGVARTRRRDGARGRAGVAGGDHEQRPVLGGQPVDGLAQRIGAV